MAESAGASSIKAWTLALLCSSPSASTVRVLGSSPSASIPRISLAIGTRIGGWRSSGKAPALPVDVLGAPTGRIFAGGTLTGKESDDAADGDTNDIAFIRSFSVPIFSSFCS